MSEEFTLTSTDVKEVPASFQTEVGKVTVYTTKIAAFANIVAMLGAAELEYKNRVYDVTTKEGDAAAREARRKFVSSRTALETARKQEKADILARGKLIDSEAAWIEEKLRALEAPIAAQIKAEEDRKAAEKAERERVEKIRTDAIRAKIDAMKKMALDNVGQPSALIQLAIDVCKDTAITKEEYQEFAVEADEVRGETLLALNRMFGAAEVLEQQQAEVKAQQEALNRQKQEQEETARQQRAAQKALDEQGKPTASTPPPPPPSTPMVTTTHAALDQLKLLVGQVSIEASSRLLDSLPWQAYRSEKFPECGNIYDRSNNLRGHFNDVELAEFVVALVNQLQ